MFFFSLYWRISWNISGEYFRPRRALIKDSWRIVRNDKSNDDWLDLQSGQFCKSRPVSFPGRRPLHPSHCQGNTSFRLLVKVLMFVLLLLFFCFCWHIFVPKIVVFIHCIYSIFMLLLLLLYRFLFSSFIITFFLQAVPHFNIDFESYMQQVIYTNTNVIIKSKREVPPSLSRKR